MSTKTTEAHERLSHPPTPASSHASAATTHEQRPARTPLASRVAMRLGLALIVWSRRTARRPDLELEYLRLQARVEALRERESTHVYRAWTATRAR